jgi:hypothetical protein
MPRTDRITFAEMTKAGSPRPAFLSSKNQSVILEAMRLRCTIKEACNRAGISYQGFHYWRKKWLASDPVASKFSEFFTEIERLIPPLVKEKPISVRRSTEWRRLRRALSSLISYHLRQRGSRKVSRTAHIFARYLGYTPDDLITYIESRFSPGMTWENYGRWQIDHKIPVSWFDFHSVEDDSFRKCWALSNLQPLWVTENASKGNRHAD